MHLQKSILKFLAERADRGCNAATVARYAKELHLLSGFLASRRIHRVERIQTRHLNAYTAAMRSRNLSPVTIRKRQITLRTFFLSLKRYRILNKDPSAAMHIARSGTRKPRTIQSASLRRLLDTSRWTNDPNVPRDLAIFYLFLDSGLRLSELTALVVDDLDWQRRTVRVRHGKADKERYSVFTRRTAAAIRKIASPSGALWGNLSALSIYRIVKKRGKQTGVHATPHMLRHTWITEFLNNGGKIHVAQQLAGHENIQTTIKYTSIALADVAREHERYSPLRNLF